MKYLAKHPIHETKHASHDTYETHAEADVRKTHQHAEDYAGAGEQPKLSADKEHRLSQATMIKPGGEETIDFHTAPEDDEHHISHIAATKANAKPTMDTHEAPKESEHRFSHIAEKKITSFSHFGK